LLNGEWNKVLAHLRSKGWALFQVKGRFMPNMPATSEITATATVA